MHPSRLRGAVLVAFAAMVLSATGLASAGALAGPPDTTTPATDVPAPTDPPVTQPPATEPPVTEAPPDTDTTSSSTEEDDATRDDLGSILLIVAIGLALAAVIGALSGRRNLAPPGTTGSSAASPKRELLANVRWLHDQLSPRLASEPAGWATQQWAADRSRVQNMAVTAQTFASGAGGGTWHRLSTAINDTVEALDACTATRSDPRATPDQIGHAVALVEENRALLMRSAEVAATTIH